MKQTFSRQSRLLSSADYETVFKQNRRLKDKYWTVLCHKSDRAVARLGLAVAKRNVRLASQRNRIKRIIRESFRKQNLTGFDLVVLTKPGIEKACNAELFSSLDRLLRNLNQEKGKP